jgi:hypothetical protein
VVDPECEYVSEFYRPVRGDLILNPVDERCPYWSPWLELSERYYEADAATLAASLIPEPPRGYESGSDHFFRYRRSDRSSSCLAPFRGRSGLRRATDWRV